MPVDRRHLEASKRAIVNRRDVIVAAMRGITHCARGRSGCSAHAPFSVASGAGTNFSL